MVLCIRPSQYKESSHWSSPGETVCRTGVTQPILQIEKLRPREAWQGWAWVGKRRRGRAHLVPAPPSSSRHVTSIPSVSSPEVSLLPMPPPAWNTPAGSCQN